MTQVFSLVGHGHFDCSRLCLQSFLTHCRDLCELAVLSDGSLSSDEKRVLEQMGRCRVLDSVSIQEQVADLLAPHPRLRELHSSHVFFKKLIDIPLLAGSGGFRYLDSDIFFWRDFVGMFDADPGARRIMAEDGSISLGAADLWRSRRPVHACVNAGILQGTIIDLDLAEDILSEMRDTRWHVIEQALYSMAWGTGDVDLITQRFIFQPRRNHDLPTPGAYANAVGAHLAGNRKHLVYDLQKKCGQSDSRGPVTIRHEKGQPSSPISALVKKAFNRALRPN
jgi:hypothetical protein